jgi:hypothetical protein
LKLLRLQFASWCEAINLQSGVLQFPGQPIGSWNERDSGYQTRSVRRRSAFMSFFSGGLGKFLNPQPPDYNQASVLQLLPRIPAMGDLVAQCNTDQELSGVVTPDGLRFLRWVLPSAQKVPPQASVYGSAIIPRKRRSIQGKDLQLLSLAWIK